MQGEGAGGLLLHSPIEIQGLGEEGDMRLWDRSRYLIHDPKFDRAFRRIMSGLIRLSAEAGNRRS